MQQHHAPLAILFAGFLATALTAQTAPEDAKAALTAGNQRFVAGKSVAQPLGAGVRRTLARGQNPAAIVLCCADSRVPPEHVFNAGLGELFVVRVAGNCVDPEALASIEYAAEHLGTQLLVVLGHERCGAIAAATSLLQQAQAGKPVAAESPALQNLLDSLQPSVRRAMAQELVGRALLDRAEEDNAQSMAVECQRRSPLLQQLQKIGRFQVLPARYHLTTGEVEWLPPRALPPEPTSAAAPVHAAAPSMAPQVALRMLQAGHRRFLGDGRAIGDIGTERRAALTEGQQPFAIVVACADSRVAPEHLFDAGLGELFVIRVAGNVLNDDVLASIEYAAAHTGAPLLLVLGHSACGAVTAAAEHGADPNLSTNLRALVDRLQPAVERARGASHGAADLIGLAVRANVQRVIGQARQQSAILRELEHGGRFAMLPAVYDLATGDIEWLKDETTHGDATPPSAAPAGETAPTRHGAHKSGAHSDAPAGAGAADGHGGRGKGPAAPADNHGAPAGNGHGDGHALDWADSGDGGDAHASAAHADQAAHVDPAHGSAHGADTGNAAGSGSNPVLLLGITGIVSLLAAAMIALRGRG